MKFRIGYDDLIKNLETVSTVVEDKLLEESLRNIIFRLSPEKATLIGYSLVTICKSNLEQEIYDVDFNDGDLNDKGVMYIQLKSKELSNFLNTFKNLKRTKPSDVVFEIVNNKIRCMVHEEFIDDEDTKPQVSVWAFDNTAVKENVLKAIGVEIAEGGEEIPSANLLLYINSMFPLLADDGSSLGSKLNFGDDYVFAVTNLFTTLFKNNLPDAFKGEVFSYSALNFLKKILTRSDSVVVSKTNTCITVQCGTLEAFLMYNTKMKSTEIYLKNFKKDHFISVDRMYFRDVLKRLSVINDNSVVEIDANNGVLKVKNSKFNQDVPILEQSNMDTLPKVTFKLATTVLDKAMIGDDNVFPGEVRIYVNPLTPSGYVLCFADECDQWFSVVQVR